MMFEIRHETYYIERKKYESPSTSKSLVSIFFSRDDSTSAVTENGKVAKVILVLIFPRDNVPRGNKEWKSHVSIFS